MIGSWAALALMCSTAAVGAEQSAAPASLPESEPRGGPCPAGCTSDSSPQPEPKKLAFLIGAGSINSPGAAGGALWTGLRLALGRHLAVSTDLGYGLAGAAPSAQDRWWLIPALAVVIPTGPVRIDLGVGAGVGTSSGYPTWSYYLGAPFTPTWHDTVPIVRAHASAAVKLERDLNIFARAEVASLLFADEHDGTFDTLWLSVWVGLEIGIL